MKATWNKERKSHLNVSLSQKPILMKDRNGLIEGQWEQQQNLERLSIKPTKSYGLSLLIGEVVPIKLTKKNPGVKKK